MEHKILAKCLGGSRLYGIEVPSSDFDERFVFINTEIDKIIGLNHNSETHWQDKNDGKDIEGKEVRHAFQLLKRANTQAVEFLFNENWIIITPEWQKIISHRKELIDSEVLFKSLMGYMQGEKKKAFDNNVEKWGFSAKNAVQTIRLAFCGFYYFNHGIFPTDLRNYDHNLAMILKHIKTSPESYTKERMLEEAFTWEVILKTSFDNRKITTKFNEDLANSLILELYKPYLK